MSVLSDFYATAAKFFHNLAADLKPALDLAEQEGGQAAIALGETVIAGLAAGTSWQLIVAAFLPAAEAAGFKIGEDAAGVVLNLAKANLAAKAIADKANG